MNKNVFFLPTCSGNEETLLNYYKMVDAIVMSMSQQIMSCTSFLCRLFFHHELYRLFPLLYLYLLKFIVRQIHLILLRISSRINY